MPEDRAIILKVGKLLTRWTNGQLKSAMHRVINHSGNERCPIPLFVHPNYHKVIDPKDFSGEQPAKFEAIVAGDQVYANFMKQRVSLHQPAS